ncbi:hypothetical protein Hypma_013838 [Hypsizygus marmoreus]|uniref:Uncharacterized protein n=1 Tax=Hypsizygus marmoreus TaxID=39966 RepID=A0A369KGM2_HYPMA|nr:hypothetical protein Hypma_013838 [Hypsizygus marmoreus]
MLPERQPNGIVWKPEFMIEESLQICVGNARKVVRDREVDEADGREFLGMDAGARRHRPGPRYKALYVFDADRELQSFAF